MAKDDVKGALPDEVEQALAVQPEVAAMPEAQADEPMDAGRMEAVQRLMDEEAAIRAREPEFDLITAVKQYPILRVLLAAGESLEKAWAYVNMDSRIRQAARDAEQRVVQGIRSKQAYPAVLADGAGGDAARDVSRMSADEIRRIDERLKRGERVKL